MREQPHARAHACARAAVDRPSALNQRSAGAPAGAPGRRVPCGGSPCMRASQPRPWAGSRHCGFVGRQLPGLGDDGYHGPAWTLWPWRGQLVRCDRRRPPPLWPAANHPRQAPAGDQYQTPPHNFGVACAERRPQQLEQQTAQQQPRKREVDPPLPEDAQACGTRSPRSRQPPKSAEEDVAEDHSQAHKWKAKVRQRTKHRPKVAAGVSQAPETPKRPARLRGQRPEWQAETPSGRTPRGWRRRGGQRGFRRKSD